MRLRHECKMEPIRDDMVRNHFMTDKVYSLRELCKVKIVKLFIALFPNGHPKYRTVHKTGLSQLYRDKCLPLQLVKEMQNMNDESKFPPRSLYVFADFKPPFPDTIYLPVRTPYCSYFDEKNECVSDPFMKNSVFVVLPVRKCERVGDKSFMAEIIVEKPIVHQHVMKFKVYFPEDKEYDCSDRSVRKYVLDENGHVYRIYDFVRHVPLGRSPYEFAAFECRVMTYSSAREFLP